jgi:hypothetical protein
MTESRFNCGHKINDKTFVQVISDITDVPDKQAIDANV